MPSTRLRHEILRRDAYTCRYCGRSAPEVRLTIDHVVPTALGGQDEPTNLVTSCADCNAGKFSSHPDSPLVEDVTRDALRWARALKAAADSRAEHRQALASLLHRFDEEWSGWTVTGTGETMDHWKASVEHFYSLGMDLAAMVWELERAMADPKVYDPWRCWCSRCWKYIASIQAEAGQIVAVADRITASWEETKDGQD